MMSDLISLMVAPLHAQVASTIFATDASGASDVSQASVAEALKLLRPGYSVTRLDGHFSGARRPEEPWRRTVPVSRLPESIIGRDAADWVELQAARWKWADHITLGEARALLWLCRRLAAEPRAHSHRVISLQDNMAVAGAASKGRSPAPGLNFILRKKCAVTLASNIRVLVPWVQTSVMPTDFASRKGE